MTVSIDQLERTADGVVVPHYVWLTDVYTGRLAGGAEFVRGVSVGPVDGRAVQKLVAGSGERVSRVVSEPEMRAALRPATPAKQTKLKGKSK